MKKVILLWLLAPLALSAQEKFEIRGKLKGAADSTLVFIVNANQPGDTIAKTMVSKNRFKLEGTVSEPSLVLINLGADKVVLSFVDKGKSRMRTDLANLKNIKWKGDATPQQFRAFQLKFDPLFEKVTNVNNQVRQTGWNDSLVQLVERYRDSIQQSIDKYLAKYPASPVSGFLLAATYQLNDDVLLTRQRLDALKPAALNTMYGKFVRESVNNELATAVGSVAADFTQADTAGVPVSLSSFRGKYVLLDFWASWCGPCRQENPNVVSNFNRFKDKNFTVLGVSLDRPGQKDRWLQAIYADKLNWTHVSDLKFWNNEVAQQYKVQSIPQNFLIGPDGKIIAKNLRGAELGNKLCELLGCN
ncbi:MAG: redoxin domain-containing protein [Chitinophagaceae bacterium]